MVLEDMLSLAPVVPVLVIEDAGSAVPLARALCAGGLRMLEVTLRTRAALEAIQRISAEVEDAIVGVGTVANPGDVARATKVGARFAVSPGLTDSLAELGPIPLLPGVATATEIMRARDAGYTLLKFFPAMAAGGVPALKAMAGPFPDIRFCPTGGIESGNAASFLALNNVICVGGSWVAPRDAVAAGDWQRISDRARRAAELPGK
ncbi:MAG TPA: bifunctional 4-hydroxy-2-oxoglutarate aldolase/2-dehydro-3-deoxy-phosphogluconate aldolase [Alphaproteobacteria bacterium]|nr:bifunctional 4-hydroxy-2-oxoglutarate aldolase/2-dehydro-3-deoxy-phosphogluconate aldolase [Alphaproteobacteria bacterium]